MMATWFQGPFEEFIRVNKEGWNKGVSILHLLGGTSVEIAGARAIAQTKMTISQRAPVHGVVVDVLCTGRFYDFFEKAQRSLGHRLAPAVLREGPHGSRRSLENGATGPESSREQFPEGYRHLAYLQSSLGFKVKTDMPGLRGPEADALYALGKKWLSGGSL
jgi:hypothetical protein